MGQPLIAIAWRRVASVTAVLSLAAFLSLAVVTFHASRTSFDSWAFRVLPRWISARHNELLVGFTEPAISIVLLALTVVLAVASRRFALAVLAVIGPAAGTAFASDVAKPFIHRTMFNGTTGTFPSGHETGVACTATVLLVGFGQLPLRRAAKYALGLVLAGWTIVSAVALTRFYYHFATDTIGAIGLSVAVVLGFAALLDRYRPARGRPAHKRAAPARPDNSARPDDSVRPKTPAPPDILAPPQPPVAQPRPPAAARPTPGHRPMPRADAGR